MSQLSPNYRIGIELHVGFPKEGCACGAYSWIKMANGDLACGECGVIYHPAYARARLASFPVPKATLVANPPNQPEGENGMNKVNNNLPVYDGIIWVTLKPAYHELVVGTVEQCEKRLANMDLESDSAVIFRDMIVNAKAAAEVAFITGPGADIFWARTGIEGLHTLDAMRTGQAEIMAMMQRDQLSLLRQRLCEEVTGDLNQPNIGTITETVDALTHAIGDQP